MRRLLCFFGFHELIFLDWMWQCSKDAGMGKCGEALLSCKYCLATKIKFTVV